MNRAAFAFWASICAILCAPPISVGQAADASKAAQELKETVDQLNELDLWFGDADRKRTAWLTEIKDHDTQIAELTSAVIRTEDAIRSTQGELETLAAEEVQLTEQKKRQATLIGDHLSAAHRLTGQDFFKQLLNQESPDRFERMIRYHRYFSEARMDVLNQFQATLVELEATTVALEDRKSLQTRQMEALNLEQQALTGERDKRAGLIAALDRESETKAQEYDRLEKNRQRLEALVAELRKRATQLDGSQFVAAKGNLPMPVEGRVRHAFGQPRADGRLRWHGLDISSPHGTPVTAIFRGRVVFSDWLRGFGLLTILDHGSGYMTLYGNVDALAKRVGDWVESGEVIASAGNSGGKKEPGVYFEVRHKGQPKDPITWVAR